MKSLYKFLEIYKAKKILLIFPHPDDEAYVSGGLLQIAQELDIRTKLICLTKGGRGLLPKDHEKASNLKKVRQKELENSCRMLGVDDWVVWDYPDSNLAGKKSDWIPELIKEIEKENPSVIVTFDHSGITGHPDHIILSYEILKIVKDMQKKPAVLWRVPDRQEIRYFKNNKAMIFSQKPTHELNYSFSLSLNKIKAVFAHKSQLKSFLFKLQILEWFLFDNKELYHLVNLNRNYPYKIKFN